MPHVGGEMFSDLAQKMYWWLHSLSQLRCHEDQSRYCNPALAYAVDSKACLMSKLAHCFSWQVRLKKKPQRIKWQSSERLLILPLVHTPVLSFDSLGGNPYVQISSEVSRVSREKGPSALTRGWDHCPTVRQRGWVLLNPLTCSRNKHVKKKFCLSLQLQSAASKNYFAIHRRVVCFQNNKLNISILPSSFMGFQWFRYIKSFQLLWILGMLGL